MCLEIFTGGYPLIYYRGEDYLVGKKRFVFSWTMREIRSFFYSTTYNVKETRRGYVLTAPLKDQEIHFHDGVDVVKVTFSNLGIHVGRLIPWLGPGFMTMGNEKTLDDYLLHVIRTWFTDKRDFLLSVGSDLEDFTHPMFIVLVPMEEIQMVGDSVITRSLLIPNPDYLNIYHLAGIILSSHIHQLAYEVHQWLDAMQEIGLSWKEGEELLYDIEVLRLYSEDTQSYFAGVLQAIFSNQWEIITALLGKGEETDDI